MIESDAFCEKQKIIQMEISGAIALTTYKNEIRYNSENKRAVKNYFNADSHMWLYTSTEKSLDSFAMHDICLFVLDLIIPYLLTKNCSCILF